jgi:hypothetical protein
MFNRKTKTTKVQLERFSCVKSGCLHASHEIQALSQYCILLRVAYDSPCLRIN